MWNFLISERKTEFYSKLIGMALLVFLFMAVPQSPVSAEEEVSLPENPPQSENVESPIFPAENNLKAKPSLTNEFSGAFVYDYPIEIAPGRNNLQPDLRLSYNSQSRDLSSFFGQGWSLSIPYIEHVNKQGVEKLYTDPTYYSSLSDELVTLGNGIFGSKVDNGEFLNYTYTNSTWTVLDKQGTRYTFGLTADSRQYDDENSEEIYKWMIEEIRDTNDNVIRFEYYKDQNQIYPSKIFYTGHGSTDGIFEIEFIRETRSDKTTSSKTGFSVTTNYRLKEIQAKVNGTWVKKYTLNYSPGDNDTTSLLASITKQGKDEAGSITTLPANTFEYQHTGTDPRWEVQTNWNAEVYFGEGNGGMMGDVNGDGLDDIMQSFFSGYGTPEWIRKTYLNNGQGQFIENQNYAPPFHFAAAAGGDFWDYGARLVDLNGDGLSDLLSASRSSYGKAYLNTGNGWEQADNWLPPLNFVYWSTDVSSYIANLNGDNLPDIIGTRNEWNGSTYPLITYAYINNGNGWTRDLNWQAPLDIRIQTGTIFSDVNGDGLDDIVQAITGPEPFKRTFINNGHGQWEESSTYIPPQYFFSSAAYNQVNDHGYRLVDINGDGLVDIICSGLGAYINNATTWEIDNDLAWNNSLNLGGTWWGNPDSYTSYITNINGDAMVDMYVTKRSNLTPYSITAKNKEPRVNLLKKLTYDTGGSTSITYTSTPLYRNGSTLLNPKLPFILDTVSSLSHNDGLGNITTENYVYEEGLYHYDGPFDAKLGGFGKVTKTDALTKTVNYYHQGNSSDSSHGEYSDHVSKIGKKYREEVRDLNGSLYKVTITTWDKADLGNGRNFVKLTQTLESIYDGNSSHKDKAVNYTYNNTNGNLSTKTEWGVVTGSDNGTFTDTGSDKFTTTYTYAANTNAGIIGLPSKELVENQANQQVKETKLYYDGQNFGNVTVGNLTKQEDWKQVGDPAVTNLKAYNSYGLITSETDPRGKVTSYTYDSYKLYPLTVTNPLQQATNYTYDYSSGLVKQTTDPNGNVFTTVYDGLDRVIEEKIPNPSGTGQVTKATYEYTDTFNARKIKKLTYLDSSNSIETYTYLDGLNRKIQERTEAATATQYKARDFIYSNGLLFKESLPYFSSNSARTTATSDTDLYTTYIYDALNRISSATTAVGPTVTTYNDWKVTVTDPEGKIKDIYRDAYDNIIQVDEHNGGSVYTTTYNYNFLRKLTKLTDALGNIRNFTYDGLGNVLSAQDLHAPADATFGTWTYAYDAAGNLTTRTDPNNQTVTFTYDNLNRVLTENYTGHTGIEVTYQYDNCTKGIGHLCQSMNAASSTIYDYNTLGQVSQEYRLISTQDYTTLYSYDRQGNYTLITNPDNSTIKYWYDAGGLVNKIQHKESNTATYSDIISSIIYNPVGLMEVVNYGNGSTTTNTYDSDELYRLRTKVTEADNANIQNLIYHYDHVGNITQIVDESDTHTAKKTNYTYDDLHRLIVADIQEAPTPDLEAQDDQVEAEAPPGFMYDAIGNMINNPDRGEYQYDGNQGTSYANPHAITTTDDGHTYVYDHNGNVLSDDTNVYLWDYNNRLIQVNTPTDTFYHFYDTTGQRVETITPDDTLYSPTKFYTDKDNTVEKHIFLGETAVATVEGSNAAAHVFTIHTDHLAGSNVVTDETQAIAVLTDYYAFGKLRINEQTGSYDERRKFAGSEYDIDSGLNYMEARYYKSDVGRFISQDPAFLRLDRLSIQLVDPQSWNSYTYARNNPLLLMDPNGEFWHIVAGAAIGAVVSGGVTYWQTGDWDQTARAAAGGAVTGAVFAAVGPVSLVGSVAIGAGSVAAGNSLTRTLSGEKITPGTLATDAVTGAIGGALGYGAAKVIQKVTGPSVNSLPNNATVCRGGTCTAENFTGQNGKNIDPQTGLLNNASVNSAAGKSINELAKGLPNNKMGYTTVGDIRNLGGNVISAPTANNPNHAILKGISPQQASNLFKVIPNPWKK